MKLLDRLEAPAIRRLWLLTEALRCGPLDKAIELARAAEAFLAADPLPAGSRKAAAKTVSHQRSAGLPQQAEPVHIRATVPTSRSGLAISGEQRKQLLDRLAAGANDTDLASEFGLTPRQVQGFRMGAARQMTRQGEQPITVSAAHQDSAASSACRDEVVRYLRQQDDVVVPQPDGEFLVNGRFRLRFAELVSRANRMRTRQRKPEFKLLIGCAAPSPADRHPEGWENAKGAVPENRFSPA